MRRFSITMFIMLFSVGILFAQTITLPYLEDFSGAFPPSAEPDLAWTSLDIDGDGFNWHIHLDEDSNRVARSESWVQIEGEDEEGELFPDNWLITPAIEFEQGGSYTLKFNYKAYIIAFPGDKLFVYIMQGNTATDCNPASEGTVLVHSILTLPQTYTWNEAEITIDGDQHTGIRYIGFRHAECSNQWAILMDNVLIRENLADDLEISSLTGPSTFPTTSPFIINVHNIGGNPVLEAAYSVQLYVAGDPAQALGEPITNTPAIPVGESAYISTEDHLTWNIPIEGNYETKQLYALVTYEADQVLANNISQNHQLFVFPSEYSSIPIIYPGGMVTNTIPVNYFWDQSLAQSIYTQEELGGMDNIGYISGLVLTFTSGGDIATNAQHGNITVYLANAPTTLTSFTSTNSYYHHSNFTQVYNDRLYGVGAPSGQKEILIHFAIPFLYAGENLVVMMNKTATATASALNVFHLNSGVNNVRKTIYAYSMGGPFSVENLPPPGVNSMLHNGYPKIVFAVQRSTLGTLTGTVSSVEGPLEGVTVAVDLFPPTTTNETGYYTLTDIPTSEDVIFSKFGYAPQTFEASSIDWQINNNQFTATLDVEMVGLAGGFTISGQVRLNDTGENTNGIEVELQGYATGTTTTATINDNAGCFEFTNLYAEAYNIAINHKGYAPYTSPLITITTSNHELPLITLIEEILPPLTVMAEPNSNSTNVSIKWVNPLWGYTNFSYAGLEADSVVGGPDEGEFILAHRYTHQALEEYGVTGCDIYQIGFVPIGSEASYSVIIWTTEDNNLQYPTNIPPAIIVEVTSELTASDINLVHLTSLVNIPENGQLFVGISINSIDGLLGLDTRVNNNGYGNLASIQGLWTTLTTFDISGTVAIYVSALEPDPFAEPVSSEANLVQYSHQIGKRTVGSGDVVANSLGYSLTFTNYQLGHRPSQITRALSGDYIISRYLETSPTPVVMPSTVPSPTRRDFTFIDVDWEGVLEGVYSYTVQARYTGASYPPNGFLSLPMPSNNLLKAPIGTLTVNVHMGGESVAGAIISLTNPDPLVPTLSHILSQSENGSHTFHIMLGYQYNLVVGMANATSYSGIHTFYQPTNTLNIPLIPVVFLQTLNGPQPEGWVNIDADGDGFYWGFNSIENNGPISGTTAAYSESFSNAYNRSLYPDNWLISPPIQLPAEGTLDLIFMAIARDPYWPEDRLLVYIAPAGNGTPGWQTFLQNKTTEVGDSGNPSQETLQPNTTLLANIIIPSTGSDWLTYNCSITQYAGQEVRLAFRHAFCEDIFILKLANVTIVPSAANPVTVLGDVVEILHGEQVPVLDAIARLTATAPLYAVTNSQGRFTITGVPATTTYTLTVTKDGYYPNNETQIEVGEENFVLSVPIILTSTTMSESDIVDKPAVNALLANYPNPFNPTTTIAFELARQGAVSIDIYNIKGQKVKTLVSGVYGSGAHKAVWNGLDEAGRVVSSGLYFYRMQTEGYISVKKMLLMK